MKIKGFTLIELNCALVILLISLLLATHFSVGFYYRQASRADLHQLISLLNFSRISALTLSSEITISYFFRCHKSLGYNSSIFMYHGYRIIWFFSGILIMCVPKFHLSKAVTLLEVLIVLAILGILAVASVPAYRFMIQNSRATAMTNEFITALAFARSTAIKQGTPVSICAAADANLNSCGGNGNWANGWIIFNDPNGDGVIGVAQDRLRTHEAFSAGTTITTPLARLTYSGSGFLNSANGAFTLSVPDCIGNTAKTVTISNTGRA